jgi:RNA polymerase sigma factor (sigma-70 family)
MTPGNKHKTEPNRLIPRPQKPPTIPLTDAARDSVASLYGETNRLVKAKVAQQLRKSPRCSKECFEDVSQDAFVRCMSKATLLSQLVPAQRRDYVTKAATCAAIDHLRARHHRCEPMADEQVAADAPVEDVLTQRSECEAALSAMSVDDAEIVRLRFFADLDLEAIAQLLGLEMSAAKARLYRAVCKAKSRWELARAS